MYFRPYLSDHCRLFCYSSGLAAFQRFFMAKPKDDFDLLITGGGLVGLTLAIAMDRAGLSCAIVDNQTPAHTLAPDFDGRTCAIAYGSRLLLETLDIWPHMAMAAGPILDIRVSDGDSGLFLHYDHRDVGDQPFGHIVENRVIRHALYKAFEGCAHSRLFAPAEIETIDFGGKRVHAQLKDGRELTAALAVAADGRRSALRDMAGIRIDEWQYNQTAIVCTVAHEKPHLGIAQERFLPAGPFAILPMAEDAESASGYPHRSSIVWTERTNLAPALMGLGEEGFGAELVRRFGDYLGDLKVIGPRWSYPLSLQHARSYIGPRLALIGDCAHAIHPISGQGLNLGLRDVAALAEVVADAHRLDRDIGSQEVLNRYQGWRRFDVMVLMAVTDGLNRLFSNDIAPLRLARDIGLGLVNRAGPLKKIFMRHAMGNVGDLPRLMQGRPL